MSRDHVGTRLGNSYSKIRKMLGLFYLPLLILYAFVFCAERSLDSRQSAITDSFIRFVKEVRQGKGDRQSTDQRQQKRQTRGDRMISDWSVLDQEKRCREYGSRRGEEGGNGRV